MKDTIIPIIATTNNSTRMTELIGCKPQDLSMKPHFFLTLNSINMLLNNQKNQDPPVKEVPRQHPFPS